MKKIMFSLLFLLCLILIACAARAEDYSDNGVPEASADSSTVDSGSDDGVPDGLADDTTVDRDADSDIDNTAAQIAAEKDQISPNYDIVTGNAMLDPNAGQNK